jgi:hypothetical protein
MMKTRRSILAGSVAVGGAAVATTIPAVAKPSSKTAKALPPGDYVLAIHATAGPPKWADDPLTLRLVQVKSEQRLIAAIGYDGSVILGEGLSIDEAAREFWRVLGECCPYIDRRLA